MPILMDSDERPIEVDDGAADEIFRLRAEVERLKAEYHETLQMAANQAITIKKQLEEIDELRNKIEIADANKWFKEKVIKDAARYNLAKQTNPRALIAIAYSYSSACDYDDVDLAFDAAIEQRKEDGRI